LAVTENSTVGPGDENEAALARRPSAAHTTLRTMLAVTQQLVPFLQLQAS
jgi:hypothetical protein